MKIPDPVAELGNRGAEWSLDLRSGYALFADYHFAGEPRGWFVGAEVALQRWQLRRDGMDATSEYRTLLLMARGGTLLHPFDNGFYLMPWLGVGPSPKISGSTALGDRTYKPLPLLAFAAVHVGWSL
jgi:hypothetical protein